MSEDRAALVALFQSTGGTRWTNSDNWETDADLSQWHGVLVNDDGRVVQLRLSNNNLEGSSLQSLGALNELKILHLDGNKLMGSIPTWLGSLSKLQGLRLNGNQLVGPIPQALRALKERRILRLDSNMLTGSIPTWLGSLRKLRGLGLNGNQLVGLIPEPLRALKELTHLGLYDNKLTGFIPTWLGSLSKLQGLGLNGNELVGPIPQALRALKERRILRLNGNKLTGPIPTWLGVLANLRHLWLQNNQLAGSIPDALGALKELTTLYLGDNNLSGPIPSCLGSLSKLQGLWLYDNQLVGRVPKELGNLQILQELYLQKNHLTGVIPTELSYLSAHSQFEFRNDARESIWRPRRENLTGGPAKGDWLDSSRERVVRERETKRQTLKGDRKEEDAPVPSPSTSPVLRPQQQQTGVGDENNEDALVPLGSPKPRQEVVGERVLSPEHASLSPGNADEVDQSFRAQLSSSAGLDPLIRDIPEAIEDIQRVIEAPLAGSVSPYYELSDMEGRQQLGMLVTMSTALGEVVLRHTEDMDVQRKELALPAFSRAYYTVVRTGLCNAYLAASVIDSDWVSTSKTGRVGKAGAALKLSSSALPVVGGLPELAGKALETVDHYLQTRRLVKLKAMAPDAVECCSLARRLALQLADGLRNDASMTADDDADEVRVNIKAGMNGGSGSNQGAGMVPDSMSEDEVFEYLLEKVASYERNDHGGERLGKKHLRKLLKAIQGGCLDGSDCTEQKIQVLLLEILPVGVIRPAKTFSTPEKGIAQSPFPAPAHDSGLPSKAEFAAMQAALESLASAKDQQQAELAAMKSDREQQQTKLQAMESANETLQRKVINLEKHVSAPDSEPGDSVDAAGGLALRRRMTVAETPEGFWDRARDRASAAADHHPLTVSDHREFEALQNDKHREHEARLRELEGEISKATKGKGRRWPSIRIRQRKDSL